MKNFSQISLTGSDAIDFAQRMFSRDFRSVSLSQGALSLFLSAEGKIQSVFWACRTDTGLSLFMESPLAEQTYELIERYHFAENFVTSRPSDVTTTMAPFSGEHPSGKAEKEGDIWVGRFRGLEFRFGGSQAPAALDALEELRINQMLPEFSRDYSTQSLVFDLGFEELCDLGKGCYIGQEVVERVRTRGGSGPKVFTLFEWTSSPPMNAFICLPESGELVGQVSGSVHGNRSLGFMKRGIKATEASLFQIQDQPKIQGKVLRQIPNAL